MPTNNVLLFLRRLHVSTSGLFRTTVGVWELRLSTVSSKLKWKSDMTKEKQILKKAAIPFFSPSRNYCAKRDSNKQNKQNYVQIITSYLVSELRDIRSALCKSLFPSNTCHQEKSELRIKKHGSPSTWMGRESRASFRGFFLNNHNSPLISKPLMCTLSFRLHRYSNKDAYSQ